MTQQELLKAVAAVTGIPMARVVLHKGRRPGNRAESAARYLAVLAARSLWEKIPAGHLGAFVGLSESGSVLALKRANALFKDKNERAFRDLARKLFDAISV